MSFSFSFSLGEELVLFGLVIELAPDRVEVVPLPVCFRCFRLHDFIIASNFGVVILSVLICDNVVLARDVQTLVFVLLRLNSKTF